MADSYRNFDLELFDYRAEDGGAGPRTERLQVRVLSSPAGDQRQRDAAEVTIPGDLRRRFSAVSRGIADRAETVAAGRELAGVLLPPPVRRLFDLSLAELDEGQGLRIRLRLDTFALSDLPWEYAYLADPDTPAGQEGPQGFLALDRRLSIVRYEVLDEPIDELRPLADGDDLRLVVLLADPRRDGYAGLDLGAEKDAIRQAVADLPGHRLDVYDHATLETLETALDEPAHVFHFAGHGAFEAEMGERPGTVEGRGFLVLETAGGGTELFAAERLAINLRRRGVRLVVLGACETGRRDAVNAWSGIAPALTQQGIPAVVGMQSPIADLSAIAFHRELYRTLAAGGTVDDAVSQGRLAVFNRGDGDEHRDWGAPVLYLRAEDGALFPRPAAEEPAIEPPAPRRPVFYVNLCMAALAAALAGLWLSRLKDFLPPLLLGLGGLLTLFLVGLRWLGGDKLRKLLLRQLGRRGAGAVLAAAVAVGALLNVLAVPKPFHLVRLVPGVDLFANLPPRVGPPPDVIYSMELSSSAWVEPPPPVEDLRRQTLYLGASESQLQRRVEGLDPEAVTRQLSQLLVAKGLPVDDPFHAGNVEMRRTEYRTAETPALAAEQPLRIRILKSNLAAPFLEAECPGVEAGAEERTCYLKKEVP